MTPEESMEALFAAGMAMYDACLVGNPTPYQRRLYDFMKKVKPGDLVLGLTAFRHAKWQRVGTLLRIEDKAVCNHMRNDVYLEDCVDEQCLRDLPREDRFVERFYWIKTIKNEHRWYNERFIRIPRSEAELEKEVSRW